MMSRRKSRGEAGQNLVEFALVLPVLLLIVIGGLNLALLWLRVEALEYAVQDVAVAAARYGGYSPELQQAMNGDVQNSLLGSDLSNFSWHLETWTADGAHRCTSPAMHVPGGSVTRNCQCSWGDRVVVVARYHWSLDAVVYRWEGDYERPSSALCWRGTVPGG